MASVAFFSPPQIGFAAGSSTIEKSVDYGDLSEAERLRILIRVAQSDRYEDAERLLNGFPFTGPLAENRTLFVQGLILRSRGDLKGAVEKFRAALANDPSLTMVRAELAQTLHAEGEDDAAKHHLELLMSEVPDPQAADNIKSFIDQIDAERPWRVSAYVSLAPSSNINGGTSADVIYYNGLPFTPDNQAKSGLGLAAGISGGYTYKIDDQLSAVVAGGINGRFYKDSSYSQVTVSQTAEVRRNLEDGYLGLGAVASQTWSGMNVDYDFWTVFNRKIDLANWTVGPRVSLVHRFSPKSSLQGTTTLEFKQYEDDSPYNGYTVNEDLFWTYAFRQDFVGFATASVDRTEAKADYLEYWSPAIGLGLYKELPWGLTTNADTEFRWTWYDADYPGLGVKRDDKRIDATISLTKRDLDFWGYAPVIEYSYFNNWSNIDLYDSHGHTFDFRLTKEF